MEDKYRRYKTLRIPMAAYLKLKEKQAKIQDNIKIQTGLNVPIHLTKLIDVMANQTVFIPDSALPAIFRRRKRRMEGRV